MNHTIKTAETDVYLTLLQLAEKYPVANEWLAQLPNWLATIKDKSRYAHAVINSMQRMLVNFAAKQIAIDEVRNLADLVRGELGCWNVEHNVEFFQGKRFGFW